MGRSKIDLWIDDSLDREIKDLLEIGLNGLADEIELLTKKTDWADVYLFEYNERALLGLFNSSLIRHDKKYSTFQEFGVYKKDETFCGRADLLVIHDNFYLLLEAKKWVYDGKKYSDKKMKEWFNACWKQVQGYYQVEEEDYQDKKTTYLGIIIFEHVKEKYRDEIKADPDIENGVGFYSYYEVGENGLMVYGQIRKAGK